MNTATAIRILTQCWRPIKCETRAVKHLHGEEITTFKVIKINGGRIKIRNRDIITGRAVSVVVECVYVS